MKNSYIGKFAFGTGTGTAIGLIVSAALIILLAGILTVGNIPAELISPATVFITAFGAFSSGFIASKIFGEKGLLCGFVSGIIFFVFIWALGGIFSCGGTGTLAIIKFFMIIIADSFGGVIGVNYIKRK